MAYLYSVNRYLWSSHISLSSTEHILIQTYHIRDGRSCMLLNVCLPHLRIKWMNFSMSPKIKNIIWKKNIAYHRLPLLWILVSITLFIRGKSQRYFFCLLNRCLSFLFYFQFGTQYKDSVGSNEQKSFDSWNNLSPQSQYFQVLSLVTRRYKNWDWAFRK